MEIAYTDITVLGLAKRNGERYVFIFDEPHRRDVLQTLGRFASDHRLSFDWLDASRVAKRVREEA